MYVENKFDKQLPQQIIKTVSNKTYNKTLFSTFPLAIPTGIFISLTFIFYTTLFTNTEALPWAVNSLTSRVVISLGFFLIIIVSDKLFTSSKLALIATASNRISITQMLKNWFVVSSNNFIGASFLVLLVFLAILYNGDDGQSGLTFLQVTQYKFHHNTTEIVALGILCNIMVCLTVWMAFEAKTGTDKIFSVQLLAAIFVALGLAYCTANMFMVPLGILIQHFAPAEFWIAIAQNPSTFADISTSNFIFNNLIPVTIGNIIGGGVIVGLMYWIIYLRPIQKIKQFYKL